MARDKPVRVIFVRDMVSAASIGDFVVPAGRGPVTQRMPWGEVQLAPGEERELPEHVAQVLINGGYCALVSDAGGGDG